MCVYMGIMGCCSSDWQGKGMEAEKETPKDALQTYVGLLPYL